MSISKDNKDRTKYIINYKLTNAQSENLPKSRVPENVFKYLIENNLLNDNHRAYFQENNFRVGQFSSFTKNAGDLILRKQIIPAGEKHRFYELTVNGKQYYVCNQWNKESINNFNAYINSNFINYIEIKESI